MAFDAASGKRLWEVANGQRFRNEQGDGPRSTPTVDGDRVYAFGGSGELAALDAATGTQDLVGQRRPAVRRQHAVLGLQRVAADRRRPHHPQRRRPPRVDRRDQQAGRQDAVAEPQRRGRLFVADAAADRAACSRSCSSPASARSRSIRATAGCCGATTARRTAPPTSRRRSCAAIACSSRPTTAPARRCSTCKAAGNLASAQEVYFTREMRNHHASSVARRRSHLRILEQHPDRAEVRHRRDGVAESQRREGFADLRGPAAVSLQRTGGGRAGRRVADGISRARPLHASSRRGPPTWSHPIITNGRLIIRDQDNVYAYNVKR